MQREGGQGERGREIETYTWTDREMISLVGAVHPSQRSVRRVISCDGPSQTTTLYHKPLNPKPPGNAEIGAQSSSPAAPALCSPDGTSGAVGIRNLGLRFRG